MNRSTIQKRLEANQQAVKYLVSEAHNHAINDPRYTVLLQKHKDAIEKYQQLLLTAHCLLPTAYCLLPTAY